MNPNYLLLFSFCLVSVVLVSCQKQSLPISERKPFNLDSLNACILKNGHDTLPFQFNNNQAYVIVAGRGKNFGVTAFTYLNSLTYSVGKHDKLSIVGFSDIDNKEFSDLSDLAHVLPVYWFFPKQQPAVEYCLTAKEATSNTEIQTYVINKGQIVYTTTQHDKEAFKAVADTLWKILARYPNKGGFRKV
jgi:hypothetical protein